MQDSRESLHGLLDLPTMQQLRRSFNRPLRFTGVRPFLLRGGFRFRLGFLIAVLLLGLRCGDGNPHTS
jgi:hypothetical protein